MPFALVVIGLLMIITGVRNTHGDFGRQVASDFTGPNNFLWWIASIGAVGALGYVKELQAFSRWFMALIIISMFLSNKGFFQKLTSAIQQGPTAPASVEQPVKQATTGPSGNSDFWRVPDWSTYKGDVGKTAKDAISWLPLLLGL